MMFATRRIALFFRCLDTGGVAAMCMRLATGLASRGILVDLVVSHDNNLPVRVSFPENVRLINLKSRKGHSTIIKLARYLKYEQPDVLISSMITNILQSLIVKRIIMPKLKLVVRGDVHHSSLYRSAGLRTRMQMHMIKKLLPISDSIIGVSAGVVEDMKKLVPRAENLMTRIPNPVILPSILDMKKKSVEHPWFNNREIPVIITVARLEKEKNQQ